MPNNKRGSNRQPGAPALPGAGRPITKATIHGGNPIRVALKSSAGYEHIGTGITTIERSGSDRVVRVALEDGSTIIITVY